MDDLMKFCVQEICYEGVSGCTLHHFWTLLDERLKKENFKMNPDFHMKKYLYSLISTHQHIAVKTKSPKLEYETDEFQKTTKLVASKPLFDKLFTFDAEITWTDGVKGIYLAILKCREKGIYQSALQFGGEITPKNVFHYLKPLLKSKLVEKIPIIGTDGNKTATNLCVASRFLKYSDVYQSQKALIAANHITQKASGNEGVLIRPSVGVFNEKVCSLLLNAPNRILIVNDLQNLLGFNTRGLRKGFMGRMQKLMPEYVQVVHVVDQNRPGFRTIKCFQLVKEYVNGDLEMLEIQHKTMNLIISPVIQVYHTILASADRGITTSEIAAVMPFLGSKVLNILLAQLLGEGRDGTKAGGPKYVTSILENIGTSRFNRYFAIECKAAEIQRHDMKLIGFELPEFIDPEASYQSKTEDLQFNIQPVLNSSTVSNFTPEASPPLGSPGAPVLNMDSIFKCKICKGALDINVTDQEFSLEFCSKKCQDISINSDIFATSKSPVKNSQKTATGLLRRQYLKDLLERNKFMDTTGRNIAKKLRAYGILKNDKSMGKHQIDIKTIDRIIDSMKASNELKIVNVSFENVGGRSIVKKIICLPTASTDGPEFKAFVQSLKEESMLTKMTPPARKVIEVTETIQRMTPQEIIVKPKLGELPYGNEGNVIAENYGFIFPKNRKMIAFHNWLFDATTPDWTTPIKERYIWKMVDSTAKMPLIVYLQCFGVRFQCPPLDRLLKDPLFDSSTPIKDLPADVKTAIIIMNSLKETLFVLISMLEVLELIVPVQKDRIGGYNPLPIAVARSKLPALYRISRRVPFFDFTVSPPLKEQITFNTTSDIDSFWLKVENMFTKMPRNSSIPTEYLFLTRERLWNHKRRYTSSQISSLTAFIDPKSKVTPVGNEETCKALAAELELSLKAVRYFYSNYDLYDSNSIERRRRKRKTQLPSDNSEDSDDSLGDDNGLATNKWDQSGSEDEEFLKSTSRPFSPEDDNLLCLAAVVLNHFKAAKKPIHVLTQIFPLRDISKVTYRRRITYLRNKAGTKMKIDTLSAFWPEFLVDAKIQQNWLSGINDALLSSNFLGVVHAFGKYVSSKDPSFLPLDEISLPEMTSEFLFKDISVACDVGLDFRSSRAAKHSFFNSIILSVPLGDSLDDFTYFDFDERSRRVELAASTMKMILASPAEDYNPEIAFKVLQSFSESELASGLEMMKDNGTVSKQHKSQPESRVVPGLPTRGISLNEKFLSFFGRYLPNDFFKHAAAYRRKILEGGEKADLQTLSTGSLAALYDLIIDRNAFLKAVIPPLEFSIEEKESSQKISLTLEVANMSPVISKRKKPDSSVIPRNLISTKDKGKGPAIASHRHLLQISTLNNLDVEILSSLYKKISDAESLGISYMKLVADYNLSPKALDFCLKQMVISNLIAEVGFSHPRYIAHTHLDDWKVNFVSSTDGSVISFTPFVYSRFDGTMNTVLYRGCSQSLLGIIAEKPGISFSGIYKRSKAVLNAMELRQILEDLIVNGFVKKTLVAIKTSKGPFDDLFDKSEQSCSSTYSAAKNFYMI